MLTDLYIVSFVLVCFKSYFPGREKEERKSNAHRSSAHEAVSPRSKKCHFPNSQSIKSNKQVLRRFSDEDRSFF